MNIGNSTQNVNGEAKQIEVEKKVSAKAVEIEQLKVISLEEEKLVKESFLLNLKNQKIKVM